MGIEQTVVILKPDALRRGVEFEILDRFRKKGFAIVELYKACPSEEQWREHYAEVIKEKGPAIGNRIIASMRSGPVMVALLEGNNAIASVRAMAGAKTEPIQCSPGTIRHDFATDSYDLANLKGRSVQNIIHSSDSEKSVAHEKALWFKQNRVSVYDSIADAVGYRGGDLVADIVRESNKQRILYHGIRKTANIGHIIEQGVLPLTSECGPCSCWSTGLALFYPEQNSPFFAFSGDFDPTNPDTCTLALVMARYSKLTGIFSPPQYEENGTISISDKIPFGYLSLLRVSKKHPVTDSASELRQYRQLAEKALLKMVHKHLVAGFDENVVYNAGDD